MYLEMVITILLAFQACDSSHAFNTERIGTFDTHLSSILYSCWRGSKLYKQGTIVKPRVYSKGGGELIVACYFEGSTLCA